MIPAADVVAIDGPAASGKSTVARLAAERLGRMYVDSGAFYRGLTWAAALRGTDVTDAAALERLLGALRWETAVRERAVYFTVDGVEPGEALRREPVRERVSALAAQPAARMFVTARLRETARLGPLVMEGRDIGTVVFPGARFKFFLDADPDERARRRLKDIEGLAERADVNAVRDSLQRRDRMDSTRAVAPLQRAADAEIINSTVLSAEAVTERIVARVRSAGV